MSHEKMCSKVTPQNGPPGENALERVRSEASRSCVSLEKKRSTTCLLVALANGDVRLYDAEKNLLHTLNTREPISALRFGPYAREDGALAVVSTAGGWTRVGGSGRWRRKCVR